jgi:hypothetical protein
MQNAEAKKAGALVSSEFAAMLDIAILPTLDSHYADNPILHSKEMARLLARGGLKVPWHQVHHPYFVVLDNDKRHPLGQSMLTAQRKSVCVSQAALKARAWDLLCRGLPTRELANCRERLEKSEAEFQIEMAEFVFRSMYGAFPLECASHEFGRLIPGCSILWPQQVQPLSSKTPELNMPAEHFVRTVKIRVRKLIEECDWGDDKLLFAVTYQRHLRSLEAGDLNGVGKGQIARSVEKMPWAARILAAPEDDIVYCHYTFGNGGANLSGRKKTVHGVKGRAGKWMLDSRWS